MAPVAIIPDKEVLDDPARVGPQSHADAGNEKDAAVGRADGVFTEVLPRHHCVEWVPMAMVTMTKAAPSTTHP
jgi:hypothetical protein